MDRVRLPWKLALLSASALIVFAFSQPSCRGPRDGEMLVTAAYVPAGYYLPFLVMEHAHLLEQRGYTLKLKRFQDNAEMISMFLNGHLDVTAQSSFTMFPIEVRHPGMFKFIYGQYGRSYAFVVREDSPVHALSDLKGETIGTWKSPTAEAYIHLILEREGLARDRDYRVQRYGATEWGPALENRTVDVVFGFDVLAGQLVKHKGCRYVAPDAIEKLLPGKAVFNGGAFISTRLLAADPKKAKAIREALLEAIEIINREPDRVMKVIAEKLEIDVETARESSFDEFVWPTDGLIESARETANLLRASDLLSQDIDVRGMFLLAEK